MTDELSMILAEFPDYDGEALNLERFEARPWSKDECPKYLHDMPNTQGEPYLCLWADYVAPDKRRDINGPPRFILQFCPWGYATESRYELEGETLAALAAELDAFHRDRFGATLPESLPLWARATAAFAPEFAIGPAFLDVLREWLAPADYALVMSASADLADAHDYCDANMAMDEAFRRVIGRAARPVLDTDLAIINAAWDVARACR